MKEFFYTITESMLDLGLRGTELNLFAIIYGYSQRGDGCCYTSRSELARRCGVASKRTIDAALATLMEKGLIVKKNYRSGEEELTAYSYKKHPAKTAGHPGANSAPPRCKNCTPPGANSAPMENKEKKIQSENTITPPTPSEVAEYVKDMVQDPQGFALYYTTQMNNNNWTYGKKRTPVKNWKNNVLQWVKNHKTEDFSYMFPKTTPTPNPAPFTVSAEQLQTLIP